jgi:hypothetical protein
LSGLSDFTKAEDSSDFTRAKNWVEGASDFEVWDIGQVTVSNFDWLSFTPLWSSSPVLQIAVQKRMIFIDVTSRLSNSSSIALGAASTILSFPSCRDFRRMP